MESPDIGRFDTHRKLCHMAKRKTQPTAAKRVRVHKPGEIPIYSDRELLALPFDVLNDADRERKVLLERSKRRADRRAASQRTGVDPDKPKEKISCTGTNLRGEPCGGFQSYGTEHCRFHMTESELIHAGLRAPDSRPGGKLLNAEKAMSPREMSRVIVEKTMAFAWNKKLNILGLELTGFTAMGEPLIDELPGGGVKLYGESKDGDIVMTNFEDLGAISKEIEDMWNRAFGKPRQTTIIEGGAKPVEIRPVRSVQRTQEVADILGQIGALPKPHSGRSRRAAPSESTSKHTETEQS